MTTETHTRKTLIDEHLRLAGWNLADPTQVVEEHEIGGVKPGLTVTAARGSPGVTLAQPRRNSVVARVLLSLTTLTIPSCHPVAVSGAGTARAPVEATRDPGHPSAAEAMGLDPPPLQMAPMRSACPGVNMVLRQVPSPGDWVGIVATITNNADNPYSLVSPGDGSEDGRRTPSLRWDITQGDSPIRDGSWFICGNMNGIRASEIFVLGAHESRDIQSWAGGPRVPPGSYRIRLVYTNDPSYTQGATGAVVALIRDSTPCILTSEPIDITVP